MTTFNTQTSVDYPAALIQGMAADLGSEELANTVSAYNAEASTNMPFGIMVKKGAVAGAANLLSGASDASKLLGVVMFNHLFDVPEQMAADGSGLLPGTYFGVAKTLRWVVPTEAAVTAQTSEVHVRHTANGAGHLVIGGFTPTADPNKTIDCTAFASWVTDTTGAGLAVLEIDMAMANLAAADT